jgi:membrane-associated phospholipid phosphatase
MLRVNSSCALVGSDLSKIDRPDYGMRTSELVNLAYFFLFTSLAVMWALPSRSRIKAVWIGGAGVGLTVTGSAAAQWLMPYAANVLRDWLPVLLMPLAYWQSGCFFQETNPKLQAAFEDLERRILQGLRVDLNQLVRTWLGGLLELAYVFCYPVVPLGLTSLYLSGFRNSADYYWTVVLLSAYPCYVLLPFIQLLPPRLVEGTDASTNRSPYLRRFNLWLVRRVTHEANTFPSGHVAASAAIALVLLRFTPPAGIVFAFIAVGIAAGCIVGRYHYIIDVVAAFVLAAMVFAIV